jgi:uncharacterized protein YrrD
MKDGRKLGTVKDLYLDQDLQFVTGLDLGSEGLFSRKSSLIRRNDIVVLGIDAVLVRDGDVIYEKEDVPEAEQRGLRIELPVPLVGIEGNRVG